jgi:UDP-N-acetylglucosamine acyltransferase
MGMAIHATAIIEPGVELGVDVEIGAYAFVGSGVKLGDRCRISHHASVVGLTALGADNEIFPFASIGEKSQDLKYVGEPTYLEIGSKNIFREYFTANRGTAPGTKTVVGSNNVFLAYTHIAHDCVVGNNVVFSNAATLAGHVTVEDHVTIGGLAAVHQFCRVGQHSMVGGCAKIVQDVPPYFVADGNPAAVRTVNIIGLRRRGFSDDLIRELRKAYRYLYDASLNTSQALEKIQSSLSSLPELKILVDFVRASERGIIR